METNRHSRAAVLFLVCVMAIAAMAGGGTATSPTIDTSATDGTATQSQIQDGDVFKNVSGTDSKESYIMQVNISSGEDVDLFVELNSSGLRVHENDSALNQSTTGALGDNFNLSYTGADIDDAQRTLNENLSVDVVAHDADNESNYTIATVWMHFDDGRTVENIDDVDADPDTSDAPVETEDIEDTLTTFSSLQSLDFSELDVDDRTINGETTDVVLVFSNDTVADDAADAVTSDAEDGDALYGMTLVLQGDETTMPIRVYNEEPPDSVDDDDDGDTYGVYQEGGIGGEDGIVIHLGEDFDDDDEVAVTGVLNAGRYARLSHWVATSSVGQSIGLTITGFNAGDLALGAPLLIGAPVARRRRVEDAIEIDEPGAPGDSAATVDAEA